MSDMKNKVEELKGTAKEKLGSITNNRDLQAEGATERAKAKAKQVGEDLKDAGRDAKDTLK